MDFKLPMPPPLLHTRSGNDLNRPSTPTGTNNGFLSPQATPQGSPSKNQAPPGAKDLPNIFDNAMKLEPMSPTKAGRNGLGPYSPNKGGRNPFDEDPTLVGSVGQENTPPTGRYGKETNTAAVSRQEQYRGRGAVDLGTRSRTSPDRGLSAEDLEKLRLPKVKRLANVAQICE